MPDIDTKFTYQTEDGELAEMYFTAKSTTALTKNAAANTSPWLPKREEFCRNVAGGMEPVDAYAAAYTCQEPIACANGASSLMRDTDVQLRIHQLKQPAIRKLAKRIEFTLNQALDECETASKLAYIKGDARTILKAVELKSKLTKLLGAEEINVNHRYGLLDDASTEVLVAMRAQIEQRKLKQINVAPVPEPEKDTHGNHS
jgi:hypothetical protein